MQYRGTDPLLFRSSQALADAIAATRELEARALKARARQHLQERLRGGAAAGPAPCATDDTPCRVADRLYVGALLSNRSERPVDMPACERSSARLQSILVSLRGPATQTHLGLRFAYVRSG